MPEIFTEDFEHGCNGAEVTTKNASFLKDIGRKKVTIFLGQREDNNMALKVQVFDGDEMIHAVGPVWIQVADKDGSLNNIMTVHL